MDCFAQNELRSGPMTCFLFPEGAKLAFHSCLCDFCSFTGNALFSQIYIWLVLSFGSYFNSHLLCILLAHAIQDSFLPHTITLIALSWGTHLFPRVVICLVFFIYVFSLECEAHENRTLSIFPHSVPVA